MRKSGLMRNCEVISRRNSLQTLINFVFAFALKTREICSPWFMVSNEHWSSLLSTMSKMCMMFFQHITLPLMSSTITTKYSTFLYFFPGQLLVPLSGLECLLHSPGKEFRDLLLMHYQLIPPWSSTVVIVEACTSSRYLDIRPPLERWNPR